MILLAPHPQWPLLKHLLVLQSVSAFSLCLQEQVTSPVPSYVPSLSLGVEATAGQPLRIVLSFYFMNKPSPGSSFVCMTRFQLFIRNFHYYRIHATSDNTAYSKQNFHCITCQLLLRKKQFRIMNTNIGQRRNNMAPQVRYEKICFILVGF